jgi:hypothetical protein
VNHSTPQASLWKFTGFPVYVTVPSENALEISDIQEDEVAARHGGDQSVTMLLCAESRRMEFLRTTAIETVFSDQATVQRWSGLPLLILW